MRILLVFISTSEKTTNDIPPDKAALYEKKTQTPQKRRNVSY